MIVMHTRFLIIKLRHHGDVLLSTPVIDALKHAYPDCQIDCLVYAETADILRENTQINRIFTIDRQWKKLGITQQFAHERDLFTQLRAQNYDVALNLSDQWRAGMVGKLCAKHAISYRFAKRNNALWQWMHSDLVADYAEGAHIVQAHLQVLQPLSLPSDYAPRVRMDIAANTRDAMQQKLRQQGWQGETYIAVHPGSRWFFKCWDDDKMIALLQKLLDAGQTVVLTAAPDERERAMLETIAGSLRIPAGQNVYLLNGNLNLRELAAVIDGAQLFIGVDSVPMHMAAALDKPQIALFGASIVHRWRPYSAAATVIWAGDYGTLPDPNSINTDDETRLLSAIPIDAVWRATKAKLNLDTQDA